MVRSVQLMRLPVSKCDVTAIGIERTLECSCIRHDGWCEGDVLCPVCTIERQKATVEDMFEHLVDPPLFPNVLGEVVSKSAMVASIHEVVGQLELQLHAPSGAVQYTGHLFRATGAVYYSAAGVETSVVALFARWGSEAFKLYVLDAPLMAARNIAVRAAETATGVSRKAPTLVVAEAPTLKVRDLRRLPKAGDSFVLNLAADGSEVAREEGRLHAEAVGTPGVSRCGWQFEHCGHSRRTPSFEMGVLCAVCFGLKANTQVLIESSDSE
jgi:hypothetical protein